MALARPFWGIALVTAASLLTGSAHACKGGASAAAQLKSVSALQFVDVVLASKCAAFTKSECHSSMRAKTVKGAPLFENVGGKAGPLKVPRDARRDATAGVFI